MRTRIRNFAARLVPLVAVAICILGPGGSASAATCPIFGCTTPVPTVSTNTAQLMANGGFEDPTSRAWLGNSGIAHYYPGITHCGKQSMLLESSLGTGYDSSGMWVNNLVYPAITAQAVTIPANTNGADLDFWARFPSHGYSNLEVDVAPGANPLVAQPYTAVAFYNAEQLGPVLTWYHFGPINLSSYAGQTISIKLVANTMFYYDRVQAGPILIDDVALWTGTHMWTTAC